MAMIATYQQLAKWTGGVWSQPPCASVSGFCFDARQIRAGQCFVALSGGARDGHDFIEQAASGGAAAALVESFRPVALPQLQVANTLQALGAIATQVRAQFKHPVVGITGSCGKTSTKEILRCLLGHERTHATAGNWNNQIGVPMTLFGLDEHQQDFAVIEAGINQPGEMSLLGQMIRADLNILTHIGPAHLELLDTLDNVAQEKSQLLVQAAAETPIILPAAALRYSAYAAFAHRSVVLLPLGEPVPELEVQQLIPYEIADSRSEERGPPSQQLILDAQNYCIASPSRGIAANAALAIVAAKSLGITDSAIRNRLKTWRPTGNRGRIIVRGQQSFYVDCYNANPSSMADALDAFVRSASPDVVHTYILGGMNELGPNAVIQHEAIGRRLKLRPQDIAVFVGPSELTHAYAAGAREAGATHSQLTCVENIEHIKSQFTQTSGAIFLKASRSYQLEKLLPSDIHHL
jgi:UDP-N-acetylmuramoyl-tripeptide--D-alanyl-D-alanine ligase